MKKNKKVRKEINKDIKNVKGLFTNILVILAKAIYTLVKNLMYISYVLIYNFDNLIAKVFNRLPRILRVIAIYSLIIVNIVYFIGLSEKPVKMAENSKIESVQEVAMVVDEKQEFEELEKIESETEVETKANKAEQKQTCKMKKDIECKIYNKGIEYGMTHEQALLIVAISRHETGNWTSNAYKNKNNFGGIMKSGKLASYKTNDEGLEAFVSLLKRRYINQGLTTPEKIQPVYCPIGAKNDPNNLNKNWLPTVNKFWNEYLNLYK